MIKGIITQLGLGLGLALGLSSLTHANQTFSVTTFLDLVDTNPGDGICQTASATCSLRAAIQEANAFLDGSTTTIELLNSGTYYLSELGVLEEDAGSGDLDIWKRVIINGAGSDVVAIDGLLADRVFHIHPGANVILNDITIQNGHNIVAPTDPDSVVFEPQDIGEFDGGGGIKIVSATASIAALTLNRVNVFANAAGGLGGGIDSRSSKVTINASSISGNRVAGFGGGISNMNGQMIINDSTISSNNNSSSPDLIFGGGIFNSGGVNSLEINRSTISDNTVFRDGAGIYHQLGDLAITNSTISGNVASRWGGGLFNGNAANLYQVSLLHVTVTDNDSLGNISEVTQAFEPVDPKGGGIYNRAYFGGAAVLSLINSLVALNGRSPVGVAFRGGDCFNDLTNSNMPAFVTKTGTLISDDTCLNAGESGPPILTPSDIDMGPLGDNGGATQTHALLLSSAAINTAVGEFCPNHDQRQFGPRGLSACDSGAYEFDASDFGEPLVIPALPYSGRPPLLPPSSSIPLGPANALPQAFDLLAVVSPGESITAEVSVVDPDGPTEIYSFASSPEHGVVTWDVLNPGFFTYEANVDASGVDTFDYNFCDGTGTGACDVGTISIVINDPAVTSTSIVVATVAPSSGLGVSPVTVVPVDLIATMSTPDFTYPLGAMFFDVTNVPTESGTNTATVTLELPAGLNIAANAVVRKMNRFGVWSTLETVENSMLSSAVFTPASGSTPATVTLVLHDNDMFDLNSLDGVISDPVAVAVSTTPEPSPEPSPGPSPNADVAVEGGGGGGGGAAGLGYLSGLLLLGWWRRRFSALQH